MRYGFTTGSCAAAASKAAAFMLFTGTDKTHIKIITPKGIEYNAHITDIRRGENFVSCSVIKDGGDDPDVTTGCHITSKVSFVNKVSNNTESSILITGGEGVGFVTKPGLDQKPGEAAINHVPREMIIKEVSEVCELMDYKGILQIEISVPEGKMIASKTFNPRLGIEGGISILGTTGIVEPMSTKAIVDTIKVELRQQKALGKKNIAITPGNYGKDFMLRKYGYNLDKSVKCSNFIGDTIDMCCELGFEKVLLTGHIGKLIKLSGGIMNTHSREGDCRMELFSAAAINSGCSLEGAKEILKCVTTEDAVNVVLKEEKFVPVMNYIMNRIMFFLNGRCGGKIEIGCIVYSNQHGLLTKTDNADEFLDMCRG